MPLDTLVEEAAAPMKALCVALVVRAVPAAEFTAWVADAKKKFAARATPAQQAAATSTAPDPAAPTVLAQARD
jgi:hypothetical protein